MGYYWFSSDVCQLFWVGDDPNSLNLIVLHINAQHQPSLTFGTHDQRRLAVDLAHLDTELLRPEASRPQTRARHGITPTNRTKYGRSGFSAAISPQHHVF